MTFKHTNFLSGFKKEIRQIYYFHEGVPSHAPEGTDVEIDRVESSQEHVPANEGRRGPHPLNVRMEVSDQTREWLACKRTFGSG